ncbi:MAG: hypothetical protein ACPGR4_02730, partial [Paracoccaceae bacterium]
SILKTVDFPRNFHCLIGAFFVFSRPWVLSFFAIGFVALFVALPHFVDNPIDASLDDMAQNHPSDHRN